MLLERHQDHERARLVVQCRVVGGRLRVEEPHGGLVPHVLLVASHRGIVQPEEGTQYCIEGEDSGCFDRDLNLSQSVTQIYSRF